MKSKNPETVPENSEEVVVPVVFTTTTRSVPMVMRLLRREDGASNVSALLLPAN